MITTAENVLIAKISGHITRLSNYRYQYDYGQILKIEGLELPTAFEAHFSNDETGEAITQIGYNGEVAIPDELFLTGEMIYVWFYVHEGYTDGRTKYEIRIPVKKRAEITNAQPTPHEQSTIEQYINALNNAVQQSEENVGHYPKIVADYWYVWDADNDAWVNTNVRATGHDGQPGISPVANVHKSGSVATITITDLNGTTVSTISDGTQGEDGNGIASARLNSDYTLTLTFTDGTSYTTPSIRGASGENGENGEDGRGISSTALNQDYTLTINYTDGTSYTTSSIRGASGTDGEDGTSVYASVSEITGGHSVTLTDADGNHSFNVMDGQNGSNGRDGTNGTSAYASVSKSGSVATLTLTDANGVTTATVSDGTNGTDGSDGVSPVLNVSQTASGYEVEVTDAQGTQTFELYNGTDGSDGQDGFSPVITPTLQDYGYDIEIETASGTETISIYNGQDGLDGQPGTDGFSPLLSVSEIQGGHTIYVTDATGETSFDVMDGVNGTDGTNGTNGTSAYASVSKSGSTATITLTDANGTTTTTISDGANGQDGDSGVYVGSSAPSDPDVNVWVDTNGTSDINTIVALVLAALNPSEGVSY